MKTNTINHITVVQGTRDYKGPRQILTTAVGALQPAPIQPGQKHYAINKTIAGGKYADSFVAEKNLDPNVLSEWLQLGYTLINSRAYDLANTTGLTLKEALNKARWQVLYNQPKEYAVYCYRVTKAILGVVKFALANGTDVNVYDEFTDKVWQFKAVANMTMCPLYQNFYVDDRTPLADELRETIASYEAKTWEAVEQEIAELTAVYYVEELEGEEERQLKDIKDDLQDYLLQGNYSLTAEQAIAPEVIEQMATVINIYGRAVGISCPTAERVPTTDTYSIHKTGYKVKERIIINNKGNRVSTSVESYRDPRLDINNGRPGYAGNTDKVTRRRAEIDPKIFTVRYQRQIKAKLRPNALEVIQAYTQVMYFIENGIENFLDDNYTICTNCNLPVRKDACTCNNCDTIRDPEAMDMNTLGQQLAVGSGNHRITEALQSNRAYASSDEALMERYYDLCSECVVTTTK